MVHCLGAFVSSLHWSAKASRLRTLGLVAYPTGYKGEGGVPRVARLVDRAWGGWRRVGDVPILEQEYAVGAGRKVYLESKGIETKQASELGGRVDWSGIRAEPKVWTKVVWNRG